jgi:hypothetical protein
MKKTLFRIYAVVVTLGFVTAFTDVLVWRAEKPALEFKPYNQPYQAHKK